MMRVLDIPPTQWASFFRMLNDVAAGRPVRLEVVAHQLGEQSASQRMSLRAIDFEPKEREEEGGDVVIALGDDDAHLTRFIDRPMRLAVGLSELALPQWICILEADGAATIVYFESLIPIEAEYSAL